MLQGRLGAHLYTYIFFKVLQLHNWLSVLTHNVCKPVIARVFPFFAFHFLLGNTFPRLGKKNIVYSAEIVCRPK